MPIEATLSLVITTFVIHSAFVLRHSSLPKHARMSDSEEKPHAPTPARRPHRLRRWLLRLSITLFILIALLLLAVQVVLWTDLPRTWVLSAIPRSDERRDGRCVMSTRAC